MYELSNRDLDGIDIELGRYRTLANKIYLRRQELIHNKKHSAEDCTGGKGKTVYSPTEATIIRIEEDQTHGVISLPSTVEGIHCWALFVEQPDGSYRVNLRSKGPIVNLIAQNHGGGGHPLASGAFVQTLEEVNEIVEELNESSKEYLNK